MIRVLQVIENEFSLAALLDIFKGDRKTSADNAQQAIKNYFDAPTLADTQLSEAITGLISFTARLENEAEANLLETTQHDYPDRRVVLTKAIVAIIEAYGLNDRFELNERAIGLLKEYRILGLAYDNNHQLIYEINRTVQKKKAQQATAQKRKEVEDFLKCHYANQENLQRKTTSLSRFLYYVDNPLEEKQMQQALKDLLADFKNDEDIIFSAYMGFGKKKWYFLNTVYEYCRANNPMGVEDYLKRLELLKTNGREDNVELLIKELKNVDKTYARMGKKTRRQAVGMMLGGFAFGMEIAMLALENLALMSTLGPLGVLGLSVGACIIFGTPIAMYFQSAHYDELEKHNQYEYFHRISDISEAEEGSRFGRFIAKLGTVEEGAAAAVLLLTLGAFMAFDMVSWAIAGGEYTSALPGLFFASVANSVVFYIGASVAGLLLLAGCVWVASCLASAHYALDGKHTIEYYDNAREQKQMRTELNADTSEPLLFTMRSKIRHKFDEAVDKISFSNPPKQPIPSM